MRLLLLVAAVISACPAFAASIIFDPTARPKLGATDLGALASVLPIEGARGHARRVGSTESAIIKRAVEFVFADTPRAERREIFKRTLILASTAPAPVVNPAVVRERLVDFVAGAIERAIEARRADDAAVVRQEVRGVLAALGWMFRLSARTQPSKGEVIVAQRRWFFGLAFVNQMASTAALVATFHQNAMTSAQISLGWFMVTTAFNWIAILDHVSGKPYLYDDLVKFIPFARSRAARSAMADELHRFWLDLEKRLARRDEWRAFVRSRLQSPGEAGIANDVREFLRALIGAKSLESVCEELLAPNALASPFR